MSFTGELIRKLRKENELTQTEAANLLGFTNVFLNRIEFGQADLPAKHVNKIAKILKVDKEKIVEALKRDLGDKLGNRAR